MKVRIELPGEIEVGKEFTGKVIEIPDEPDEPDYLLLQAEGEPEVFVVIGEKKCWIQTPKTAQKKGYDLGERKILPLNEVNKYSTGDTILWKDEEFVVGDRPRDIYFPEEPEEPETKFWHPETRGLLTLATGIPSADKLDELGFNLVLPFKTFPGPLSDFSQKGGQIIFMKTARNENTFNVLGYCVEDEPENRPQSQPLPVLWARLNTLREKSDKPMGCIFNDITLKEGTVNRVKYNDFMMALDWVGFDCYPYRKPEAQGGWTPLEQMELAYGWVKDFPKPLIVIMQAHKTYPHQIKPAPVEQVKFWRGKGFGYIVYPWSDGKPGVPGVADMQNEWKTANEWAASH